MVAKTNKFSRAEKLSELEEKLKQPVTKSNWKTMYLSSLYYGVLKDFSYPEFNFLPIKTKPSTSSDIQTRIFKLAKLEGIPIKQIDKII